MRHIQLTRGLAAAAVGALAMTGLTVAGAAPAGAAGPGVVFVSLFNQGNDASLRYEDNDEAITLAAMRLDPAAAVAFEYNTNPGAGDASPGWTATGVSPTLSGSYARATWTPPGALVGSTIAVRAVATTAGGVSYATRQGVLVSGPSTGPESVSVDDTTIGFFKQPYASTGRTADRAAVAGTTSSTAGTAQVGWWNPGAQAFQGTVNAEVEAYELKIVGSPSTYLPGGAFYGDLDITAFGPDAGEIIAVGAELDTDDVAVGTLYAQTVGAVSVTAQDVPAGQPTTVTVTVVDSQASGPIAGAEVRRSGDGALVGYTDGAGRVRDVRTSGSVGTYYVNTTDSDAYDGADVLSGALTTYTPSASYVQAVSADGRFFDDDEYAGGDLYLQAVDEQNLPVGAGTSVSYRIYPSNAAPPATYQTASTNAQGRVPVTFAPSGPDGAYTLDAHHDAEEDRPFRFTAGDATLSLTPTTGSSTPGGQVDFKASLTLAGQPLVGRRLGVSYQRGVELVPGTTADAGLLSGASLLTSLVLTTDRAGTSTFTVKDPAEKKQGAETGGKVALATQAAAVGTLTGNANETASGSTAFGSAKGKAKVRLKGSSAGDKDKLVVKGQDSVAGEKVKFFRVVNGKLRLIRSKKLGKKGDATLKVADKNGRGSTTYVVKLVSSVRVKGSTSKKLTLD